MTPEHNYSLSGTYNLHEHCPKPDPHDIYDAVREGREHDLPPMTSRLADKNRCSHHMHRVHPHACECCLCPEFMIG